MVVFFQNHNPKGGVIVLKRDNWIPWTYLIIFSLTVAAFWPAMSEFGSINRARERRALTEMPTFSPVQLDRLFDGLERRIKAPISDPAEYYRIVRRANISDTLAEKTIEASNDPPNYLLRFRVRAMALRAAIMGLQKRYEAELGLEKMREASKSSAIGRGLMNGRGPSRQFRDLTFASARDKFMHGYMMSIVIAFFFFIVRLRHEGLLVWVEGWRLLPASATWPVAMFRYPRIIDPREQLRRAVQFASYFLATMMSFAAMGGVAKAQEKKDEGSDKIAARTLVVTEIPKPVMMFSAGVYERKLVGNGRVVYPKPVAWGETSVRFTNGVGFSVWGSKALDGSAGADEVDYTLSWGHKTLLGDLSLGLAYFDIGTIGSDKGGDVIDPSIMISREIAQIASHHFGAFVKAEALIVTRDTGDNFGFNVAGGMNHSFAVTPQVRLGHSVSLFYADGPFGAAGGTEIKYDASISVAVTPCLTVSPLTFRAYVPVTGMHDRSPVTSLGASISYTFN